MNNELLMPTTPAISVIPLTYADNLIPLPWDEKNIQLLVNGSDLIVQTQDGRQLIFTLGAELASLSNDIFHLSFADGTSLSAEQILKMATIIDISPNQDLAPIHEPTPHQQESSSQSSNVTLEEITLINTHQGGGDNPQPDEPTYTQLAATTKIVAHKPLPFDGLLPKANKVAGSPPVDEGSHTEGISFVVPDVTLLQLSAWRNPAAHRYQVGTGVDSARGDGQADTQYKATLADLSQESADWTIDVHNSQYLADGMVSRIVRFDNANGQVSLSGLPEGYQAIIGGTSAGNEYGLLPGELLLVYPQGQYDSFKALATYTDKTGQSKQEDIYFTVVDNPSALANKQGHIQLAAKPNNVKVVAGSGDDLIIAGKGNDHYDGGAGSNTVDYNHMTSSITVDLSQGSVKGAVEHKLSNIQNVIGTNHGDTLIGNDQDNNLLGGHGNDLLQGGGGNNRLDGGGGINSVSYEKATASVNVNLSKNLTSDNGAGGSDQIFNVQNIIGSQHDDILIGNHQDNLIKGGHGDDMLIGMGGNNILDGGSGINTASYIYSTSGVNVDLIAKTANNGFGGTDQLINIHNVWGSDYDDTIRSGSGSSTIYGGAGNDTLIVGGGANDRAILDGGEGDDLFIAGYGYNTFIGGGGLDTIDYSLAIAGINISLKEGRASSNGFGGIDQLNGITGIVGTAFNDVIELGDQDAIIDAGGGDDLIIAGGRNNSINGGSGINTLDYSSARSGIGISLLQGQATKNGFGGQDNISNIQHLVGSAWNDLIEGDDNDNIIYAGAGDDYIYGSKGNDVLDGGSGTNTLDYSRLESAVTINSVTGIVQKQDGEQDRIASFSHLIGSDYDDIFIFDGKDKRIQSIKGGEGFDTLDLQQIAQSVTVDLAVGKVSGAVSLNINSIEKVVLSNGNNTLIGSMTVGNELVGGKGNDIFRPQGGNNIVTGGGGSDWVHYTTAKSGVHVDLNKNGRGAGMANNNGFGGQDVLNNISHVRGSIYDDYLKGTGWLEGGRGNDTLNGEGSTSAYASYNDVNAGKGVLVDLQNGITRDDGYGTKDTLIGIHNVTGSQYADTIYGSDSNNIINTGNGDDTIYGSKGNDRIDGGSGVDTIDYSLMSAGVNVDLSIYSANKGVNGKDTLLNMENITGSIFDDILTGNNGDNVIRGGGGNDILRGLGGNDILIGGNGFVTADYSLSPKGIVAHVALRQVEDGYGTTDMLIAISKITGSKFNDVFNISSNMDLNQYHFDGGQGNDTIKKIGNSGNFVLGSSSFNITNIDRFDFADGKSDRIDVDLSLLLGVYGKGAKVSLNTDNNDMVNIAASAGGWTLISSSSNSETWSNADQTFTWQWA